MNQTPVNRTYKDSLFRLIFREKTELLSLYNAINHSDYQNPDELIIYTLEDTLYIGRKNDSAFLIDSFLNINHGHNMDIMNACRKLYEYSYLIEEIRKELAQGYTLSAAIDRAIDTCIRNGILEDLLRKERVRVKNTILFDYDAERHIKSEKEESYQEGYDIGRKDASTEMFEAQIKHLISLNLSDADICRYANCDQSTLNIVRSKLNLS